MMEPLNEKRNEKFQTLLYIELSQTKIFTKYPICFFELFNVSAFSINFILRLSVIMLCILLLFSSEAFIFPRPLRPFSSVLKWPELTKPLANGCFG